MRDIDRSTSTVVLVPDANALGRAALDRNGNCGTVTRVYRVGGVDVAMLTCGAGCKGGRIQIEPVDLLTLDNQLPAVPGFSALVAELGDLEVLVLYGTANTEQRARYLGLRAQCAPYLEAPVAVHEALTNQVKEGDRVLDALHGWTGTVVDADLTPTLGVRLHFTVRLDQADVDADPWLREHHPDGKLTLPVPYLLPILDLL